MVQMVMLENGTFDSRRLAFGERKCLKFSQDSPMKIMAMNAEKAVKAAQEKERLEAELKEEERIRDQCAMRGQLEEKEKEKRIARCLMEQAKPSVPWTPITQETVTDNHDKSAPGMFYWFDFPWTQQKIIEFGPAWLTMAFHEAQTISKENEVLEIIPNKREITAGNNGAKCLFDVRYKINEPGVDTQFFAKLPYPMTPQTMTDRISSSFRKQPMDWCEINTYRLLEANLPFKTPKYYFGDISAKTSNFVLILGRIEYAELFSKSKGKLRPFEVEGPYDKCKDYLLKSPAVEYYRCIFDSIARVGGQYCAGTLAPEKVISNFVPKYDSLPQPAPTAQYKATVKAGYNFISDTAKTLYPEYVQEEWFEKMYTKALMQLNAYVSELAWWKEGDGAKPGIRGIGHMNLNIDNAYFWRNEADELEIGVLDWGGFGVNNMAHKLWWSVNCSQFEMIRDHGDNLIKGFLKTFKEAGGADVNFEEFKMAYIIVMLQNFFMMVGAIPNSMKMCKASEFKTITSFKDPRIASDVHGKSTLRTTVNVLNNGIRMIGEMGATKYLDRWVQEVYVGQLGKTEMSDAELLGE